jgi:hypothetical protein
MKWLHLNPALVFAGAIVAAFVLYSCIAVWILK